MTYFYFLIIYFIVFSRYCCHFKLFVLNNCRLKELNCVLTDDFSKIRHYGTVLTVLCRPYCCISWLYYSFKCEHTTVWFCGSVYRNRIMVFVDATLWFHILNDAKDSMELSNVFIIFANNVFIYWFTQLWFGSDSASNVSGRLTYTPTHRPTNRPLIKPPTNKEINTKQIISV